MGKFGNLLSYESYWAEVGNPIRVFRPSKIQALLNQKNGLISSMSPKLNISEVFSLAKKLNYLDEKKFSVTNGNLFVLFIFYPIWLNGEKRGV